MALLAFYWLFYLKTNDNIAYMWDLKKSKNMKGCDWHVEKSFVIWSEPYSRSSFGHYPKKIILLLALSSTSTFFNAMAKLKGYGNMKQQQTFLDSS